MSAEASQPDMPLTLLAPGESARVSHIKDAGHGMQQKLTAMGIAPGVELSLLTTDSGPLVIRFGNARLGIGRSMAHRIMVKPF